MALPPAEDRRVPMRRGTPGPRGGGVYLSRVQQTRLLDAAAAVVAEEGVKRVSATRVAARAGMSTKTFYDLFADGEECFLGVFDRAVDQLATVAGPVWAAEGEWVQRVRGALIVLLAALERDPRVARVVFVEALGAGPRVLARRAEVLDRVAGLVDEGRVGGPAGLPSLVGAGVVGAAFSIVHARLLEQHPGSLMELVNPVMATVVLPYQGRECSARELERAVPELPQLPEPAVSAETTDRVEAADRAGGPGSSLAGAESVVGRVRSAGRGKSSPVRAGRGTGSGRRGAGRGAIEGGVLLAGMNSVEYRRVLLLRAAAAAVDEHGYGAVTVAHITARAKISRRTFYELFVDREQCLLAVMEDIEQQLINELRAVDLGGLAWRERVRLGLWTVLRFFDREPGLARFCVVESARGDDRMAAYRAELLARIAGVIAEGGEEGLLGEHSLLAAEGVAGAVVSILSTRLAATGRRAARRPRKDVQPRGALSDLLGELMALIVLPYLGSEAAREERARPAPATMSLPVPDPGSKQGGRYLALDPAPSPGLQMRMTYRTALVLEAIAQAPGTSNLGVARHAQINDQGQVSKLLARLERNGLVQNTGRGHAQGAPNEWRLTPAGEKVERGIREHQKQAA